jgi:hypothetical protein
MTLVKPPPQILRGIDGMCRLPLDCQVGDWAHLESFNWHMDPPEQVIKFLPRPRVPMDLYEEPLSDSFLEVYTFRLFTYIQNGI